MFKPGMDYLGGAKYEKAMLATHPQGWCAGIFLNTFGKAHKTVERMCASGKFSEIVVHMAPFDNSHTYPIERLKPLLKKESAFLQGLQVKYPHTRIMPSPFCEHNHKAGRMAPLFKELQAIAPSCLFVNSIWKGQAVPGIITEIHIESSRSLPKKPGGEYIVSFDGFGGKGEGNFTDCNLQEIAAKYADARQFRGWNFMYNGKYGWKDKTPIKDRKEWPSEKDMRGHNAMFKTREATISYPDNALYKPFADNHDGPQAKDNKALVICQADKNSVDVKDKNGKVIHKMNRVRPDHKNDPKGARYYSALHAYEIGDLAMKSSGSRAIIIDNLPLTDADLRSNKFR